MSPVWSALLVTGAVGIGTYLSRAIFIVTLADRDLPPLFREALRFVAPAVMAALVVSLLYGGSDGTSQVGWVELSALGVGGLVGWRTHSLPWVLVSGMSTLWLLRWIS